MINQDQTGLDSRVSNGMKVDVMQLDDFRKVKNMGISPTDARFFVPDQKLHEIDSFDPIMACN